MRGFVAVLTISIAALLSCARRPAHMTNAPETSVRSHYIRRTNADDVIVFMHGIFGNAESTWTNNANQAYWPRLLTQDQAFDGADIYVHAFSSPFLGSASAIDELVEQTNTILAADEVFTNHKRVIFLCHSMGGLITRGLLRRYRPLAAQVPLIYFYATPTNGADITRLVEALGRLTNTAGPEVAAILNPQIRGMLPAEADAYTSILVRDWQAAQFSIVSRCAYEERKTYGVQVVTAASASALCSSPALPIERDHLGIVKPSDREDIAYKAFRQAYREIPNQIGETNAAAGAAAPLRPTETMAATLATQPVQVACGQTADHTISAPLPIALKAGQQWVDTVVSLQQGANLKEQRVEVASRTGSSVNVHYRLVGLDPDRGGRCNAGGSAALVMAFLLTQPSAPPQAAPMPTTRITQKTTGDLSPAIAGAANVTIIRNAEPVAAAPNSSAAQTSPPSPSSSALSLATNPALHGLLLNQRTRGTLSPALAAIGGSVFIQDNTPVNKRRK